MSHAETTQLVLITMVIMAFLAGMIVGWVVFGDHHDAS